MDIRYYGVLIALCFLCTSCTDVVSEGDIHTLKSKFYIAVLFPLIGIILLAGGIWACIRILPGVWKSDMSLGWKGRRSKIAVIPIAGMLFLLGTLPRMQYQVIVGPDYAEFHELGKQGRYAKKDIRQITVFDSVSGKNQRRLGITVQPQHQYFINESEIGTESFEKMVKLFKELKKK